MRDFRLPLTVLLGLLAVTTTARAASPSLGAVRPTGGQRGTELEINLTGARLADAKEILFFQPGITTTKLQVVSDAHVKATVRIAPDAPLGIHDIRLRTATGISELRTFNVGAMKEVEEKEPNNDFAAPQVVPMNVVVNGIADNEDVDYFVVEAKKGERISAEVEGIRLGIFLFDPYVAIQDAKRFELASSDDAALVWQDGFASVVAPADGKYIIQVRESAYAGNGSCLYRLHIGNFPRATATVPAGGKVGDKVKVKWIGDVLGDRESEVALPNAMLREYGIENKDDKGVSPAPNTFRLSTFGNVIEAEPNDEQAKATPFTAPLAVNGVIGKADDNDYFVFPAKKGQTFDIRVFARQIRSPLDPVLHIIKKGGNYLAGNDDSVGPDSYIRFGVPEDGEYILWIHDHLKKGGPDYAYRIEVVPVEPKLNMTVVLEQFALGSGSIAAAVPKGGRQAILVYGNRVDFGGELKVGVAGQLPPGVEIETDNIAANQGVVPVLFKAKADAPVGGSLIQMTGEHVDPKVKIPQEFSATSVLVYGQNNISFWQRTVDKLAVAVTDECPYEIEIVEPKVPLVRGGSMNLKVIAKRKPGFTAPISLSIPWLPPGVGASGGIAIPEKANEAIIPMNADGGAELKTWRIVVNGASSVASGPISVSSQLAKLTIAQQFVTLAFQPASVEQGKEVDLVVGVNKAVDFPGEAVVNLIGLPNKVTTDVKKITKDTKDMVFKIKTDKVSPAGNHVNLFCQVIVTQNGEPIVHNLGTGQIRIDVPLPPKPAPVAAAPAPKPVAAPAPAPPAEKRLSRLEKLRLESKERAQAAAAGAAPAATAPKAGGQ